MLVVLVVVLLLVLLLLLLLILLHCCCCIAHAQLPMRPAQAQHHINIESCVDGTTAGCCIGGSSAALLAPS